MPVESLEYTLNQSFLTSLGAISDTPSKIDMANAACIRGQIQFIRHKFAVASELFNVAGQLYSELGDNKGLARVITWFEATQKKLPEKEHPRWLAEYLRNNPIRPYSMQ